MDKKIKNCSSGKHSIPAINYCPDCNIYLCNKCQKLHSELFEKHQMLDLNKNNSDELFTGICEEKDHKNKLIYYCKTHNKLCCVSCISKIIGKGNGQHTNCEIKFIEEIKETKKNKLKENLIKLEELSTNIVQSINKLKDIFKNINDKEESIKKIIMKIFTKLRNQLDEREAELLSEIDNIFKNIYFEDKILKKSEKLPNKIKKNIEKGKNLEKNWNEEHLNLIINDCINIENDIKDIDEINNDIKKYETINIDIKFEPDENKINKYLDIKNFGYIYNIGQISNLQLNRVNKKEKNKVLLITDNKTCLLLSDIIKYINIINVSEINYNSILPNVTYDKIKDYKIIIYDLKDAGYTPTKNFNEISNYLLQGGNIILTHDHWTHFPQKGGCESLLGAELKQLQYTGSKKVKILNDNHPVFYSFFDLNYKNGDILDISETHKTDTVFKDEKEYFRDLVIELEDNKHGEYLLIKEIGKGKLIFWNTGHSYNLTDFELKLFFNLIYWVCE